MRQPTTTTALLIILSLIPILHSADEFDLTLAGKSGTVLYSLACNIQTTLDFYFSPSTTLTDASAQTLVIILISRLILVHHSYDF